MALSGPQSGVRAAGFTLLELMIVCAIIATISTIGVPMYVSSLHSARLQKAKEELRVISRAIDQFRLQNQGELPDSLDQVGHGGRRDPWGTPFCYLNVTTGSGDGMQWAIEAGLVDPGRVREKDGGTKEELVVDYVSAVKVTESDTVKLERIVERVKSSELTTAQKLAVRSAIASVRRCDHFLFPLNSDYDLFSLGPNGKSASSIASALAADDVIRANDGGYFGRACDY